MGSDPGLGPDAPHIYKDMTLFSATCVSRARNFEVQRIYVHLMLVKCSSSNEIVSWLVLSYHYTMLLFLCFNLLQAKVNKTGNVRYVWRNIEAHSCNHCCTGKAISITFSEHVFVALVNPACNAQAPYCNMWPVRLYNIFRHYLTNSTLKK
jgi:hypothetical protein